jgi:hypothetical protein
MIESTQLLTSMPMHPEHERCSGFHQPEPIVSLWLCLHLPPPPPEFKRRVAIMVEEKRRQGMLV